MKKPARGGRNGSATSRYYWQLLSAQNSEPEGRVFDNDDDSDDPTDSPLNWRPIVWLLLVAILSGLALALTG
jgi:hypothetical protein